MGSAWPFGQVEEENDHPLSCPVCIMDTPKASKGEFPDHLKNHCNV